MKTAIKLPKCTSRIDWRINWRINWASMNWLDGVGIATLVAVTAIFFNGYPADDMRRWAVLGIMFIFGAMQGWFVRLITFDEHPHWHLAFLTVLTLLLVLLHATFNGILVLFFVLSSHALAILPTRTGYLWVIFWGALTTAIMISLFEQAWTGLYIGLGTTCGYIFIGSAANAQRRAELAHAESQRLLRQLQAAHTQLQAYTVRSEELAVAQERNRLAREMHDTLGHRLTVAAVQLEGAQRLIARDPDKAARMVGTVREQVIEGLAELRRTVATLRIPLEADLALPTALTQLATNFQQATGIVLQLALPKATGEIPPEHHHALYRAAQEMLTNVQRHAQAKHVWLQLDLIEQPEDSISRRAAMVQVSVEDDGRGFPADQAADQASLRGLRERAEQLHGELLIKRGRQGGSHVTMRLPLPLGEAVTSDHLVVYPLITDH